MQLKKLLGVACLAVMAATLSACSGGDGDSNKLLVAHTHGTFHPVHTGLNAFCDYMQEHSNLTFNVYPNGTLGNNSDLIQMVRAGVLDIAKVSAPSLEQFNSAYSIFSLPYVFSSEEHYFRTMRESTKVKEIFEATREQGFIAIGWYDAGQRSIYTVKGPIKTPEDLHGLKIRTQDSPTSINMINAMGASATPMSGGEVYSALQQGIIDGAENNETVLGDDGHGQVAKFYSYTEHQYTPDIVIMSTKTFDSLSPEVQQEIYKAMDVFWQAHETAWKEIVKRNTQEGLDLGVKC